METKDPATLQMHPDADLARRMWWASQEGTHKFFKVKAHDLENNNEDDLAKYHKIGNHVADQAAKRAMTTHLAYIASTSNKIHLQQSQYKEQLHRYYQMLLRMFQHRAKLDAEKTQIPNRANTERMHEEYVESLCNFTIRNLWIPPAVEDDRTHVCSWGRTLTRELTTWMSQVRWSQEDQENTPQNIGVTWVELAMSFALGIGALLPVKRKGPDGKEHLIMCKSMAHAVAISLKLSELGDTLQKWITQVHSLQAPVQWPDRSKGLVKSLYTLGAHHQSSGFHQRPIFPRQQEVVRLMQTYLKDFKGTSFHKLPEFTFSASQQFLQKIEEELKVPWEDSCKIRQSVARQLKRERTRMDAVRGVE